MMDRVIDFFFTSAYAADASTAAVSPQGSSFSLIIMFIIFFVFLYFGIWRPQNKRMKEQQNLLGSLAKGDEVVTVGGLLGKITKLSDKYLILSIANEVDVTLLKSAVANVLPKGTLKTIE